jgi:hypothetical protein
MIKPNWLITEGNAKIYKGEIEFQPISPDENLENLFKNYGTSTMRSDLHFMSGEIECFIQIKGEKDKVQFQLGIDNNNYVNVGLNLDAYAYGIAEFTGGHFQLLSKQGHNINPPTNEWLKVKIKYIGSILELFINNVLVAKSQVTIHNSQVKIIYKGIEEVKIKDIKFFPKNPQAFIVMQFSEVYNSLYKEVILPVCEEYGYEVIRADDMYTTGLIIEDITRAIQESSLVIADITPNNPNVYYEVGYAHGINKSTILLSDKNREKIPFDISGFRLLFYENSIAGKPNVETALRKHLEAIKNA